MVTGIRTCVNQVPSGVVYVMSDADVAELAESIGSDFPARIIFHSHPNSSAFFSSIDIAVATGPFGDGPALPVQQLVVGLNGIHIKSSALFAWSDAAAAFVGVARFDGAPL